MSSRCARGAAPGHSHGPIAFGLAGDVGEGDRGVAGGRYGLKGLRRRARRGGAATVEWGACSAVADARAGRPAGGTLLPWRRSQSAFSAQVQQRAQRRCRGGERCIADVTPPSHGAGRRTARTPGREEQGSGAGRGQVEWPTISASPRHDTDDGGQFTGNSYGRSAPRSRPAANQVSRSQPKMERCFPVVVGESAE
jgi:hypothetical protein